MELKQADPKGLIRESYRIEGISEAECRSIFMDWALSLAPGTNTTEAMRTVLALYEAPADHPMSLILAEGLTRPAPGTQRRGGAAGRRL
ncbi:hypothetical protein [Pseudothioclava arenosa]|uniref:Uncharacterized protein n=1 Tax=Pseudothioclava arenosa TaxID=1795308 RepID=A0A2A4CTF1_9RHOB|nr:hypothetical protein [Pseudothioclava arenosa]PCD77364.1 hypothetical protein CLN94_05985 [Pseudothioclava arenosa]